MRLFLTSFLITLNVCWFGLVNLPMAASSPETDWRTAQTHRAEAWGCTPGLKSISSRRVESQESFCDVLGYHPSQEGVKRAGDATETLKIVLK